MPKRQTVILNVPLEGDEDPIETWKWQDLIDTSRPVHVLGKTEIYEAEDEESDAKPAEE